MIRFTLWVITVFVALSGCTEKGKPYYTHEAAKPDAGTSPLETPDTAKPGDSTAAMAKFSQKSNPLGAARDLAKTVLSKERILDPKSVVSRSVHDDLLALNTLILSLKPDDLTRPEFQDLGRAYASAVLLDCGEFRDSCTGLKYFKLAANSSQVVKMLARLSRDHRIRLILIAMELKNRMWDQDLVELLMAVSSDKLSEEEESDVGRAQALLSQTIADGAGRVKSRDEARRLLDSIQGWSILTAPRFHLDPGATQSLFELAARADYLHGSLAAGQPAGLEKFKAELKEHPKGVFAKQKSLMGAGEFIPEAAGAAPISAYDDLTFLLDAVFTGQLLPQSAMILARPLKTPPAQVRAVTENYLRLQFLAAVTEGSKVAAQVFRAPLPTESLLRHALNQTDAVRATWQALLAQAEVLKNFVILALNGNAEDQAQIRNMFEGLPKTVTRAAVYPHMMVLFHIMSKKRFELYLRAAGKSLNSDALMKWLFEGQLPPLFMYTDDETSLSPYGLVHSFDLAVRTGLFDAVAIDPDDFIADTLRRLTEESIAAVDANLGLIRNRMTETLGMRDFKNICAEVRGGAPNRRTFYFAEVADSPYLGHLSWLIHQSMTSRSSDSGYSGRAGEISRISLGLNFADGTLSETLEIARLDLGSNLRLVGAMVASYRDYLVRFKLPRKNISTAEIEAEADRRTSQTRELLAKIQAKRKEVVQLAGNLQKDLGDCYIKVANADRKIMEGAVEYERLYLRHVHKLLTAARQPGLTPDEREKILKSTEFTGLPGGFTGRDRLLDSGFHASRVDLLIRVSRYIMDGLEIEGQKLPPLAPQLRPQFGERLDLDVPVVRDTPEVLVPYVANEQEFVASALKVYFAKLKSYLTWYSLNGHPLNSAFDMIKNAISVYRFESELTGRLGNVRSSDILEIFDGAMDYANMTPLDRDILSQIKMERRIDKISLNARWLKTNADYTSINFTWGLYDFLLIASAADQLGYVFDMAQMGEQMQGGPQRLTTFLAGRKYYETRMPRARGNPVVPYGSAVDHELDQSVGSFVRSEIRSVRGLHEAVVSHAAARAQLPIGQRPHLDIDLATTIREPLYTEGLLQNYLYQESQLHRQTDGMFK